MLALVRKPLTKAQSDRKRELDRVRGRKPRTAAQLEAHRRNEQALRAAKPEKYRQATNKSHKRHREEINAAQREAYRSDLEKSRANVLARRLKAYWSNPEKSRTLCRAMRKANPVSVASANARTRAKRLLAPGSFTNEEVKAIFDEQHGFCAYCSDPAKEIDHWVPLSRWEELIDIVLGPPNGIDNLQWLCKQHNRGRDGKHNKNPLDYEAEIGVRSRLARRYYRLTVASAGVENVPCD